MVPQDLHIHTVFSRDDGAVVPFQTVELIAAIRHAAVIGISDHLESIPEAVFPDYASAVRSRGFRLGAELCGPDWADYALSLPLEYQVYHCRDDDASYRGAERLVASGRPLIIAHPLALGTDLGRLPPECIIEINNRYVWKSDWKTLLAPWVGRFRFVISSDAHQPGWLGQNAARYVAAQLGVVESLLFPEEGGKMSISA